MRDRDRDTRVKIIRDKKIPQLEMLTDPERTTAAFEEFFRREYPERGLKVTGCDFGHAYHKPGKSCRMNFFLAGEDGAHQPFEQSFYAKISANGKERQSATAGIPDSWPGCGFWKPVSHWPEMSMKLYAFPYDPEMPYLGQLLEPDFIKRRVEENLDGFGLSSGWKCEEVIFHRAKYRNGKSCTLRYELRVAESTGYSRKIEFYGKTYASALSLYVYKALQKIYASPACVAGRLIIPAPITHLDEANTMWQRAWPGTGLNRIGEEKGWVDFLNADFVPKSATMLAALHQVEIPDLVPGPAPTWVIKSARGDASDIVQYLPEKETALEEITRTLEASTFGAEAPLPQTTIHGAFKVAQILYRDGELAVVDFDAIACGDPLYDVAEFLASIIYLRISDDIPAAPIRESVALFLRRYQEQVPWPCERRRVAWYLVAFILAKIHASLKRTRSMEPAEISRAFALVQEWLEQAR